MTYLHELLPKPVENISDMCYIHKALTHGLNSYSWPLKFKLSEGVFPIPWPNMELSRWCTDLILVPVHLIFMPFLSSQCHSKNAIISPILPKLPHVLGTSHSHGQKNTKFCKSLLYVLVSLIVFTLFLYLPDTENF
jgi:hypothetical protein